MITLKLNNPSTLDCYVSDNNNNIYPCVRVMTRGSTLNVFSMEESIYWTYDEVNRRFILDSIARLYGFPSPVASRCGCQILREGRPIDIKEARLLYMSRSKPLCRKAPTFDDDRVYVSDIDYVVFDSHGYITVPSSLTSEIEMHLGDNKGKTVASRCVTFKKVSLEEIFLTHFSSLKMTYASKKRLAHEEYYTGNNRALYYGEVFRNYSDTKQILIALAPLRLRKLYFLGDGPGLSVMALHAMRQENPDVMSGLDLISSDKYMCDDALLPIEGPVVPMSGSFVVCVNSYYFVKDVIPIDVQLLIYDRQNPQLYSPSEWVVIRPYLYYRMDMHYLSVFCAFNSVLLSLEQDRGPLGNSVLFSRGNLDISRSVMSESLILPYKEPDKITITQDNSFPVFFCGSYTKSHPPQLTMHPSYNMSLQFLSFPNDFYNALSSLPVSYYDFTTTTALFWSSQPVPMVQHMACRVFDAVFDKVTIKCFLYYIDVTVATIIHLGRGNYAVLRRQNGTMVNNKRYDSIGSVGEYCPAYVLQYPDCLTDNRIPSLIIDSTTYCNENCGVCVYAGTKSVTFR